MKITGAYTGSIGGALHSGGGSNINISDLAKAVAGRGESRNALGAYRGSGQTTGPPRYKESVIRIVVGDKHGAYCISPGQRLVLWRPKAAQSAFTVVIETGKIKKEISWPAGAVEVGVPDDVLENKPRRIVLTPDDSTGATRARLWFGEYGDTPGEQLKWYESRSCHTQFESALTYYQTF